jgi:Carbohydrate-selective porin, OprB family/S-layer homology domain
MMSNRLLSRLARPALMSTTLTVSAVLAASFVAAAESTQPSATVTPAAIAASATASSPTLIATAPSTDLTVASLDQVKVYGDEGMVEVQGQVTSVSQLSDVKPTDWAFQALQSLVERYGCIAGYPDKTYRGNRALTRYEFAAGLNACLDRVNELIAAATADLVKKEDLATLQKLQEEFAAELATLRGRVDSLEARTATLEKQQFSTTTKLRGEVIFSVSGALGDEKAVPLNPVLGDVPGRRGSLGKVDRNTVLSDRVRLSLNTSFTGKDTLLTRIQARNNPNFSTATGTNAARLSYEGGSVGGNAASIDKLYYRFPLSKATVTLDAVGGEFYANIPNFNPLLASDGQGALSRFGRFNPIYRQGASASGSGAGLTVNYPLSNALTLSLGYMADDASDPNNARGLFNGSNAALAQIAFKPMKDLDLGLTYVRSYDRGNNINVTGATGGLRANQPFGAGVATSADQFGLQASYKLGTKAVISGWGGFTKARREVGTDISADIWNWAVTLAFPDLGKKGNLAAIIAGQPPRITSIEGGLAKDSKASFHLEGLYRYQLNDKISVTPGLIVIFNPENASNDTVYMGTIRTTFTF